MVSESTRSAMNAAIQRYLLDTLGMRVNLLPWSGAKKLPYFLQEAFAIQQLSLHGQTILLALDQRPGMQGLADLRMQIDRLRTTANMPVVYVTDALASYERKRLIEQRVPFLVPGNQLYLPDLGIDLREYFRSPQREPGTEVSPATQAVLIALLLSRPWRHNWVLADVVAKLGYSPMTLTRVVRELAAVGLDRIERQGRERQLHLEEAPQALWQRLRERLSSPIKRSIWVPGATRATSNLRLAGLSALARLTSLTDPPWPVYALGPDEWRLAKLERPKTVPHPVDGCSEWQLWTYSTTLVPDRATVDPLSLMLSLETEGDERVQKALDELRSQLPW